MTGKFYHQIDTVLCLCPGIPAGSRFEKFKYVDVIGFDQLVDRLTKPGPRPPWAEEDWDGFARHLGVYHEVEDSPDTRRRRADTAAVSDYRHRFRAAQSVDLHELVPTTASLDGKPPEPLEAVPRPAAQRWVCFFEHIEQYHRLYGALLGKNGSSWFAAKMRASLTDMVKDHLLETDTLSSPHPARRTPSDGLAASVLGAMFTQSITWWLDHGMPVPARVIATQSAQLAGAVIAAANEWAVNPVQ